MVAKLLKSDYDKTIKILRQIRNVFYHKKRRWKNGKGMCKKYRTHFF